MRNPVDPSLLEFEEPCRRPNSIRLDHWGYDSDGLYFVTVTTQGRQPLFGRLVDGTMHLSDLGRLVVWHWNDLPAHFPHVVLDEWVVMPDHFHGIVAVGNNGNAGDTRFQGEAGLAPTIVGATAVVGAAGIPVLIRSGETSTPPHRPTLGDIVGSFKSASTRAIRRKLNDPGHRVWQRGYHDRIIRKAEELDRIRKYIMDNPGRG